MNFTPRTLTLPLLAALLLGSACREGGPYAAAPVAGTGAGGAPAAPTSGVATLAVFNGGTVTGTATFTKGTGTDVIVNVALATCVAGKMYPVHIHQGVGCADAMTQGDHWGPARGEGIPNVLCGATGTGTSTLTRPATDPTLAWTIGGDATTNVLGHAFVVHAPDMPTMPARIACGVIAGK